MLGYRRNSVAADPTKTSPREPTVFCRVEHNELTALLAGKAVPDDVRPVLAGQLLELRQWLHPPLYHRPRPSERE